MAQLASQIWICTKGQEVPDWIVAFMTTADIDDAGSFEIEAGDGIMTVQRGMAVFEYGGKVYACLPRDMPKKLAGIAGSDNPAVVELEEKSAGFAERSRIKGQITNQRRADKPLKLKPMIGVPPAPQFISIAMLKVDDTYQRSIEGGSSRTLIRKIAENWDWRLCMPLLVSRRAGELYVIDGQHRLEAAILRGDIPHLPVVVFDFGDPKAEAELFVQANRSRRPMSKLDDFHAAVIAGDLKAKAVNDAVVGAGLSVSRHAAWQMWKPGEVVFVTAIERALNQHGDRIVGAALSLIARAFDGEMLTGVGAVFEGLIAFISDRAVKGVPIEDDLMVGVLAGTGIPGWRAVNEGIESGPERAAAMLRAITAAYTEADAE